VARLTGVSARSVRRIAEENPIVEINDAAERSQRHIPQSQRQVLGEVFAAIYQGEKNLRQAQALVDAICHA
jgi:hypothetical protein